MEFRFTQVLALAGGVKALARRHHELMIKSKVNVTVHRRSSDLRAAAIVAVVLLDDSERVLRDVYNSLGFRGSPFEQFVDADWNELIPAEDESAGSENKLTARLLSDQLVDVSVEEAQYALRLAAKEKLRSVNLTLATAARLLGEPGEMPIGP